MFKVLPLIVLTLIAFSTTTEAKMYPYIIHYGQKSFVRSALQAKKMVIHADSKSEAVALAGSMGLEVGHIEEDARLFKVAEATDPFINSQWPIFDAVGGISLNDAWDETTGSADTVIAVLDTGYLPHRDLEGRILPGYDFISTADEARDGDGRDSNARDEGDYTTADNLCPFDFAPSDSSWHGTHVAGTIVANTNNNYGIAGINHKAKLLPVRVLGRCGGLISDISDGIIWAAGGSVPGVPSNPNPAHVINLSLGGFGQCGATMQQAIDFANSRGSVVVVAAGNEGMNMDSMAFTPATCRGVITVGATARSAYFASYSNRGESIDIAAPGGDGDGRVVSLGNGGRREPAEDLIVGAIGTSMATPHISGVVSLIHAVNPNLFPAQVEKIIKRSTNGLICPQGQCGPGIIDAAGAVLLARETQPDSSVVADEPVLNNSPFESARTADVTTVESGACGSISFNTTPSGGSGLPKLAFILTVLLGLFFGSFILKLKKKYSK